MTTLTASSQLTDGCDVATANAIDRLIRISTAVAVLAVGVLPAVQSEVRVGVQKVDGQLGPVPKSCSPSSWPSREVKRARSVRSSARP